MANQTIQLYNSIKEDIIKGNYSPSESLKEVDLSNQYGVSRNTVKKCLLMLEKEGLIIIEPNKGAKVRSYSLDEVLEFLELRAFLEGFITKLAVPAFDASKIKLLEDTFAVMSDHFEKNELIEYSKGNQKFHKIIHDVCPNQLAVEVITSLKNQMSKYNTKTILIPGRSNQSFNEHSAILNAIKDKDAESAKSLMIKHILNVKQTFKENYSLLI